MKQGWEIKKLGEVCEIIGGGTPSKKKKEFYNGDILWATVRDMNVDIIETTEHKITIDAVKNSSTNIIPKGNVIIATRVGLGKVCLLKDDTAINQDLKGVIPINQKVLSIDFLYRWFASISEKIINEGTGATVQGVKLTFINSLPIALPKSKEQKRIVAILDKAFTAIAKAKTNAEQNLKNAKKLFESYLQGVFENKEDDWEKKALGEVCIKIQDGAHHSPKILYPERGKGLFPYITSKNIKNNYMDLSKLSFVDEKFHMSIYPRCKAEIGDILLTKDGAKTGNITLNTLDEPFSLLSSVCLIKPYRNKLQPEFLKFYIQSPMGFKSITGKMTGAAIKRIILRAIKSAIILLPPLKEQQTIVKKINVLSAETKTLEVIYQQKIEDLEELKKSVLQKAFNGEL